ncbi:MAG: hypothetical protein L0216_00500 [Planctomycetales bacterium]|nr:hypothetical protein [Planctomycetales bacterium]
MRALRTAGLTAAGLLAAPAPPASAQGPAAAQGTEQVRLSAEGPGKPIPRGGSGEIRVEFRVARGWHVYGKEYQALPTRVRAEAQPGLRFGEAKFPPSEWVDSFGERVPELKGSFTVTFPFSVEKEAKPGKVSVPVLVSYQVCDEKSCKDPVEDLAVPAEIEIAEAVVEGPAAPPGGAAGGAPPAAPPGGSADPRRGGLLSFLLVCIGGGLISLIMPCVYPLLPITATFFVKQSSGGPPMRGLFLAATYGLGIVASFTLLGVALSVLFGAAGAQQFAANPWVNIGITAIFFYLALALFGAVPLELPAVLRDRLTGGAPSKGYGGAFFLGNVFTVVTFSCTIPVAATLLTLAAQGSTWWAVLGMLVYSTTMAIPFLLFGAIPGLLKNIPKQGGWMHTVKVTAGLVELALCAYYLSKADFSLGTGVFSRDGILAIWLGTTVATATYLFGFWRLAEDEAGAPLGVPRVIVGIAFAGLSAYLVAGLGGRPLGGLDALLPDDERLLPAQRIYEEYEPAATEARATGKPIFLEFTGFS